MKCSFSIVSVPSPLDMKLGIANNMSDTLNLIIGRLDGIPLLETKRDVYFCDYLSTILFCLC